ncbi:MAG TPA: DUF6765 family protein [Burkholderiaceae bacterium]|jgi:hypothetical protein|nr:DUF6765 family protein [Burkholderiaceae bacterium]
MNSAQFFVAAVLAFAATGSSGFESDVHFGLTQWLALQAGFDEESARTIATGDQRVDSGDMQYVGPVLAYACVATDDLRSRLAGERHYPSAGPLPGAPEARAVVAGSDAAKAAALSVVKVPAGQANYMLFKLGEALHILQDSWSHQGIAAIPQPADGVFACDRARAWAHPAARGGWNSHKADLTMAWPGDTAAMARAVYDVLTQYPPLSTTPRTAHKWEQIVPSLDGFIKASTKTEKKRWFASHGISDASFLEGISLRDGAQPFDLTWPGRKLPPLATPQSRQHAVDAALLDFFNRFFAQWVATNDFDALASAFGPDFGSGTAKRPAGSLPPVTKAELVARLKVWRLRDHGRVAEIAHAPQALTVAQRSVLDAIGKDRKAYAVYDPPSAAFFPLLPRAVEDVSPLVPFFVSTAVAPDGSAARAVAVVKFRHVPYDTLGVIAEQIGGRWRVMSIVSVVDH